MKKHLVGPLLLSLITLTANFVAQAQSAPQISRFTDTNGNLMMITGMSDNAQWGICATAGETDVDNPQNIGGSLINLKTHQITNIAAYPANNTADVRDVADNGIVVGMLGGKPAFWDPNQTDESKKWTAFTLPITDELYRKGWTGGGSFISVTPDGRYAVGFVTQADDIYTAAPIVYDLKSKRRIPTPDLPSVDLSGIDQRQNVFYDISPDGRYILGQMSQSYMMPVSMFSYIYDLDEETWTPIGYTYNETTQKFTPKISNLHFINDQHFSADGNWVTGSAYIVNNGGELSGGTEYWAPYRYEVATDNLEIFTGASDQDVSGNQITNAGDMLASAPIGNPYATAYVRKGKFFISLDDILSQVYGMDLARYNGDGISGSFHALSADGLTALMITYDNCYLIRMNEPFIDAAAKVDLLANHVPSIPEGSSLSSFSGLTLTFDRSITYLNVPSLVTLKGSDGSTATAVGIGTAPDNDHKLVISFRTRTLTPGVTYTLNIAANAVMLKEDTSIKSKAMSFKYVGRANTPVVATSIDPASGALISQLNSSNDVITLACDTQVLPAENAAAYLYIDGESQPLATLACITQGKTAIFYPTSTYYLYEGTNYRVVIPDGTLTDLSGGCPNGAIELSYTGAYVRHMTDSDRYIFNDPCNSYDNFIYFDGKANINHPSEAAQEWDFSDDNNAWVLTRDGAESSDWAITTHSMFASPGTADAWMLTPQLFIPDDKAYLAFDAQSYLNDAEDRLEVFIYEYNGVFNYMTDEIRDDILANGILLFNEILSPGATEEKLADEWTHYTCNLAPYAGKNIYIAFANRNTDQSAIFIDNVQVIRDLNFIVTNQVAKAVVNLDKVTVKGIVSIANEIKQYSGITLTLRSGDNIIATVSDPAAALQYRDTYAFEFTTPLTLVKGAPNNYSIEVVAGEDSAIFNYTVKNLLFEPLKKVVLEEFTGSDCGNCPLGINAIEHLERTFPDNFIAVTLRAYNNDYYANGITGYASFLGMSAAPTGRVNRGSILSPMVSTGHNYEFNGNGLIDSDGNEVYLWADAVADEMETPAEAEISCAVNYNASTGALDIPCTVRHALNIVGKPMRLFAVVLEDGIYTSQDNYLYETSDPNLGEWGKGGIYGQSLVFDYVFNDVSRFVVTGNNFNGELMQGTDFVAGSKYTHTLKATAPGSRFDVPDGSNCKVVVMLIDGSDNSIINATQVRFGKSNVKGDANCDGTTDIADAQSVITAMLSGTATGVDINADGILDISDAQYVINQMLN